MQPPYLTRITRREKGEGFVDPTSLPLYASSEFEVAFNCPLTILVGENGSGKSTLLEAIAEHCEFSRSGGSRNHVTQGIEHRPLAHAFIFSWKKRLSHGFFLRAQSLEAFGKHLDEMAEDFGAVVYGPYGGRALTTQSHGESFLAVLRSRFSDVGLYILDEPEAALSPTSQFALLTILNQVTKEGRAQVIMATHSPILMSCPGAQVLEITDAAIQQVEYSQTKHFTLMARFMANPEAMQASLFEE